MHSLQRTGKPERLSAVLHDIEALGKPVAWGAVGAGQLAARWWRIPIQNHVNPPSP